MNELVIILWQMWARFLPRRARSVGSVVDAELLITEFTKELDKWGADNAKTD